MSRCVTNHILIGTSVGAGPVQRMNAELGRRLVDAGYNVSLLVHGSDYDTNYIDHRIGVLMWPSKRPNGVTDALFLDDLIRRLRPCCVIGHFGAAFLMLTVGTFRRVPVRIRWYHTLSTQINGDRIDQAGITQWFHSLGTRYVFKLATHMVPNSDAARQDLIKTFHVPGQKCQVFWNALQDPLENPTFADSINSVCREQHRFVCAGRFDPSKGQDIALRAFARVVRELPDARLVLVGDGPTTRHCESLAQQLGITAQCTFTGKLVHQEVLLRMASARATIVPSRSEAFGLVNIESMSLGVPVIGSNTGGIAEIVRNGVDGILFPPGDDEALSRAMIKLSQNVALRSNMSVNCRKRFLESFELSQAITKQVVWISGLIRNSS